MAGTEPQSKSLFYQIFELTPNERQRILDEACGDNLELRLEVEALLRCHDEITRAPSEILSWSSPLDITHRLGPGREHFRPMATVSPLRSSAPAPKIPGYEIEGKLGEGGMGVVYLARQVHARRLVALKLLRADSQAVEEERKRFRIEAEAIARLQHPGIVQIFEVGEQQGRPFFSLEYCSGGSLDRYLGGTPLPSQDCGELVLALARAVQMAHSARVLHRDLKPANVLLTPVVGAPCCDPDEGDRAPARPPLKAFIPKLTDFGLARKLDEAMQTRTGLVMGTPSYMAPEQVQGSANVGVEADVYALGAILYECLTGAPPFKGTTSFETLLLVTHQEPVSPRLIQPSVPLDLETICLKCLSKNPSRRYASAESLADDLQRFLHHQPIQARPVGLVERGWRWARRNLQLASLIAALFLVLLVGILATGWAWFVATQNLHEANLQRESAQAAQQVALESAAREQTQRKRAERMASYRILELVRNAWEDAHPGLARKYLSAYPSPSRGWEYHYLNHVVNIQGFSQLHGHGRPVNRMLFSPTGKHLVSLGGIGPVFTEMIVWNVPQKRLAYRLETPARGVKYVCFNTDGTRLAAAGFDDTLTIWDLRTGKVAVPRDADPNVLSVVEYDARKKAIVEKTIPQGEAKEPGALFNPRPATSDWIALSPDGKLIVTGRPDVKLWDRVTLQELRTLRGNLVPLQGPMFCGGSQRVAWLDADNDSIRVCDTATGKVTATISDAERPIRKMAFSPDGKRVAVCTHNGVNRADSDAIGTIRLVEVETQRVLRTFQGHTSRITCLNFSEDGKFLASADEQKTVILWDVNQVSGTLLVRDPGVATMRFCLDGERLLTTNEGSSRVQEFASTTGLPIRAWKGDSPVDHLATSPDGKFVATAERDSRVHIREADTGREVFHLKMDSRLVYWAEFSPDGKYLAASTYARPQLTVWDLQERQSVLSVDHLKDAPLGLSFSPDSTRLAVVDHGGLLRVWNISAGQLVFEAGQEATQKDDPRGRAEATPILAVCYHPDGKRIATGDAQRRVRLWDADSGRILFEREAHDGVVTGVSFSPDGDRLASCGRDGIVKLWDPALHEEVFSLTATVANRAVLLTGIAFSPEGRRLAAVAPGNGVHIWDAGVIGPAPQPVNEPPK